MKPYDVLAWIVDFLHLLLIAVWVGGWFVSSQRYPVFRQVHSCFGIVIFPLQLLFGMRCPMVVLSAHLRKLAHPEREMGWYMRPFVVRILEDTFGFSIADICVTIAILFGAALAIWTLIAIHAQNNV